MALFTTIICSINLTEHNDDIARYTLDIAKDNKAKIILVHALPSSGNLKSYTASSLVEDLLKEARASTERYVEDFKNKHFAGFEVEAMITNGNPGRELLKVADKYCADLIVMGSISQKGMFSFMLGNTSGDVVGKTRVPVLTIPNDLSLECVPDEHF